MNNNFKIDFIGIGSAKCATTWVYRCLLEHPEICGSYKKELGFFLCDNIHRGKEFSDHISFLQKRGINYYKKYFFHCPKNSIKGEFSVSYLTDSGSARLIKEYFPDIKIIICLRDPVKRAHSFYWFLREYSIMEKSATFEQALENDKKTYIEHGMYYKYIKNYLEIFPRENVGIFFVDDLKKDPAAFIQEIYKFVGADHTFIPPSVAVRENSSKKTKYKFLRIIIRSGIALMSKFFKKSRLYFIVDWLRCIGVENFIIYLHRKINTVPFSKPPIDKKTEQQLRETFKEDIEKLEIISGRDLSSWKPKN